jgi:pyruvate dehydrogenase E2 component (dihydrolipoamide acetyltransferase)
VQPSEPADETARGRGQSHAAEPSRAERTLARRAAEARATIPDIELIADLGVDAILRQDPPEDHLLTAVLARACALALREFPRANAAYRDGSFECYSRVNIGVAVSGDDPDMFPTVFDADAKPVSAILAELTRSARRLRAGELTSPELSGATFTLANYATSGVRRVTPIITPPHAAALAAGAVREVPVIRDGTIVAGHVITIALACDSRILSGARATRFLSRIKHLVEQPESL